MVIRCFLGCVCKSLIQQKIKFTGLEIQMASCYTTCLQGFMPDSAISILEELPSYVCLIARLWGKKILPYSQIITGRQLSWGHLCRLCQASLLFVVQTDAYPFFGSNFTKLVWMETAGITRLVKQSYLGRTFLFVSLAAFRDPSLVSRRWNDCSKKKTQTNLIKSHQIVRSIHVLCKHLHFNYKYCRMEQCCCRVI